MTRLGEYEAEIKENDTSADNILAKVQDSGSKIPKKTGKLTKKNKQKKKWVLFLYWVQPNLWKITDKQSLLIG